MTARAALLPREGGSAPLAPIGADVRREAAERVDTFEFAEFAAAIEPRWLSLMQAEAAAQFEGSTLAEQSEGLAYKANISGLGPVARKFLQHPDVVSLLTTCFGGAYALSEEISCLTFYDASGHLGAHLDEPLERCTVTIIIYLSAVSPDPDNEKTGLVLNVYGRDKASIGAPVLRIPTREGTIVLGHGSRVWHERPRLKPGESVTAITGCYRLVS